MLGIDTSIAEHRLNINPTCHPVKQKPRQFGEEKLLGMKEEIKKLLKAGFIREIEYPTWLANVVMVKKRMGSGECASITLISPKLAPKTVTFCPKSMHW